MYTAQNAYIVYSTAEQTAAVAGLAGDDAVRAVTPFSAADKTAPGIDGSGTAKVAVETPPARPGAAARKVLASGEELPRTPSPGARSQSSPRSTRRGSPSSRGTRRSSASSPG